MEQAYCTAVFWRGGEKIDLNGRKPDAVRCLSVTGERKVNLSFLRALRIPYRLSNSTSIRCIGTVSSIRLL